jgi:molybdate transport system ATP-binding protein
MIDSKKIVIRFNTSFNNFALDVDLTLPAFGVSVLFGASGCGKTTLLRCISGLQPVTGDLRLGDVIWQDSASFVPVHQRSLGYVFQEASLFVHLSVKENLLYGYKRVPKEQRKINFADVVKWFGLADLMHCKPENLSGGQRQRVAIARALLTSPRLLLMDEPLVALDFKSKAELFPYLERLRDELDIPIIYVTHSLNEMARLADTLIIMDQGKIVACGNLADTLGRLDLPSGLFEDAGVVLTTRVAERDDNWHLVRVEFSGGSLWMRDRNLAVGSQLRVRVLAKDVSLATQLGVNSIQNVLPGTVDAISDDSHPSSVLVRVAVGETIFLAQLTRRAVAILGIKPRSSVWVQVKSVALVE